MTSVITEELFLELGELLNSNLDEFSILRTFCNKVLSLFSAERVSLLSMEPQGRYLNLAAWAGRYPEDIKGVSVPVGDGVAGWVAATGDPVLVQDVDADPRFSASIPDRYRTKSFISVPLTSRGRILGVLNVADTSSNEGFSEVNLRTMRSLALQVGMGMENIRLRDRLGSVTSTAQSLVGALQGLNAPSTEIESGLLPALLSTLEQSVGHHNHLVLIGEMGTNRAWLGRDQLDREVSVEVLDFRSGFSLYQNLAAQNLTPPFQENPRLMELGFPWDLVVDGTLCPLRSLLPPRHNLFGIALSAVPNRGQEYLEILRSCQNIVTQFGGLALGGIFDHIQIRKLDHLKTELISTVSHELRTPLTSIQGFAEYLLRGGEVPEAKARYLGIIYNESRRLNSLISDFLELARLESGGLTLVKEPADPVRMVESAVRTLKPQAEARRASIRLRIASGLPALVADHDRVEQVLVNLIGNALKHGGQGVHIEIAVSTSDGHTAFEVSDDGPGIPPEDLPMVFNRFYRGSVETQDEGDDAPKGTGLGLAMAREIVEQHGGSIGVRSQPGSRTTFRFTLPTQGLVSPQRGVTAWHPGDENFTAEVANRLAEGKTVGVLTLHVNSGDSMGPADDLFSVEAISEIEEHIGRTIQSGASQDDLIQSRPQGEFLVLTYASLVDDRAEKLLAAFAERFGRSYAVAIGAAVAEGAEDVGAEQLLTLSRQACEFVEADQGSGYMKNRRT